MYLCSPGNESLYTDFILAKDLCCTDGRFQAERACEDNGELCSWSQKQVLWPWLDSGRANKFSVKVLLLRV